MAALSRPHHAPTTPYSVPSHAPNHSWLKR